MSTQPAVSVIIPAFNQADFIEDCLDSVVAQTFSGNLEIIVIDDGSPDDVAARARNHYSEPRVISQNNAGVAGARNRGIRESSAPWIAFLDADDRWMPHKLEDQMSALRPLCRPALSFTRYRRVTASGTKLATTPDHPSPRLHPTARKLMRQNFIGTSTVLVHRACIDRCDGFPESEELNIGGQDYALWLRIAAYFPLVYIANIATHYTVHDNNSVGVDSARHHRAGLRALYNFNAWDPQRFRTLSPISLNALIALRSGAAKLDSINSKDPEQDQIPISVP